MIPDVRIMQIAATFQFFFGGGGLAVGHLILGEAGGVVTDMAGQRLDFGHGAKLLKNTGVVSAVMPRVTFRYIINSRNSHLTYLELICQSDVFDPPLI